ncbi:ABC transporter permease [Nocardiopsis sediminis]|uniref:ABC transporter permease n=1 Tax=Nocardiopsis sediminis TaxID=1778267 RepID=A0ABV8FRD2_9ACTN
MLRSVIAGIVLAFAGSRANVSRTILSCAGIVVGVGALITVVTAGDVGERFATSYTEANFGVAATMQVDVTAEVADVEALETDLQRAGGQAVSLAAYPSGTVLVRSGGQVIPDVETTVVDAALGDIRRLNMREGRWFTEADTESLAPVLVVNEVLADQIGDSADLQIGGSEWRDVRVVGVVEGTALDSGWSSAYLLRSPASVDIAYPGAEPDGQGIQLSYAVRVDPGDADEEAVHSRLASAAWRWGVDDPENAITVFRIDGAEEIEQLLFYLSLALLGIAGITLATGLLGVLNVGLVTVRERRRELATYRALGASRLTLFVAVVTESVVVSMVAGAVALASCYGLATAADALAADFLPPDVAVYVPFQAVLVGLGSAAGVGLLAGVIPAWRALSASVVAGLRE